MLVDTLIRHYTQTMKNILFLIFVSIMATTYQVTAQNDTIIIKGHIKDTLNGEAISLTEIRFDNIINSKYSTQADLNGFFKIKVSKSDFSNKEHKLYFYYMGYQIRPKIINLQSAKKTIIIYGQRGVELLGREPVQPQEPLIEK